MGEKWLYIGLFHLLSWLAFVFGFFIMFMHFPIKLFPKLFREFLWFWQLDIYIPSKSAKLFGACVTKVFEKINPVIWYHCREVAVIFLNLISYSHMYLFRNYPTMPGSMSADRKLLSAHPPAPFWMVVRVLEELLWFPPFLQEIAPPPRSPNPWSWLKERDLGCFYVILSNYSGWNRGKTLSKGKNCWQRAFEAANP